MYGDWRRLALAVFTNVFMVGLLGGMTSAVLYLSFVGVSSFCLPFFFFHRRLPIDRSILFTLAGMFGAVLISLGIYSFTQQVNLMTFFENQVSQTVNELTGQISDLGVTPEELKTTVLQEFPSVVAVFALIMVWANFILLIRLGQVYVEKNLKINLKFLKEWKAPEFLIWPTIVAGGFLVFDIGWPSVVGMNFFRFLMAIYALQGLSVLAYFFDSKNIKGFLRSLGYVIAIWPLMPLLLAVGFFDLWFDFRAKMGQTLKT